jgi:glycosyltransferase involved in cell wall biosynthesis
LPRPSNRLRRVAATLDIFRRARATHADVYHFHDPELLPVGLLLKRTTHAKVIYDVHEDYSASLRGAYYLPRFLRPVLARIVSLIEKQVTPHLDMVIAATDEIGAKFLWHRHTVVIHNYPIIAGFLNDLSERDRGSFRAVYAGVMTPERGLAEVIGALDHVGSGNDIRLSLYGKFVPEKFEDELRRLSGADRADFKGHLPPEKVWHALAEADVGVVCFHPGGNHERSMPNKLFEYMTASLPVVASNFPLWKEIVEGNGCGITVNPLSPREIAAALCWLQNNPEEAKAMGIRGRKAVLAKYSWETESKRLIDHYQSILLGNQRIVDKS